MKLIATYPEFEYNAGDLKKYIEASGLFSILLKCGKVIHYKPKSVNDFRNWLQSHNIFNLRCNE
jgi:hypothetical protein